MAKKHTATKKATGNKPASKAAMAPLVAPGSPKNYRVRVRMYRQGLGDCFLVTFPRKGKKPFQILIDCGALARDAQSMTRIVEHIRDTVRDSKEDKARLDLVVATHEHKDHLSGFNQAREVFDKDFDFGAVWLGWTENLTQPEIKKIKEAKKKAVANLRAALNSPVAKVADDPLDGVAGLLAFSEDDDTPGSATIADALAYLKLRGKAAGDLQYFDPGVGPLKLDGVEDVRVYVLGPPRDPILLKGSEVTEQMKKDDVIYHLASTGEAGMDALSAALSAADAAPGMDGDRYYPFAVEHRIAREVPTHLNSSLQQPSPYFDVIRSFVTATYDDPAQGWRRIDHDWLNAFGQLALDLDSDTNNTSLVLAFEFVKTREVLLFVGDAQVGNWQSWAKVEFKIPDSDKLLPAHDLLSRTAFYKVGHHCSHNATLKREGLELMTRDDLVAFIPLDRDTAAKQGKKDPATGKPKGWEMPAPPLYKALLDKAQKRVVISDVKEDVPPEAKKVGVVATDTYIDYFLK
jgi:beta-lactamase superfamily II metal-dependent hydrolase